MRMNKSYLIIYLLFFSLIFADNNLPQCDYYLIHLGGDQIDYSKLPVYYSKESVLTKSSVGEVIVTESGPYIEPDISGINWINQQNNINLLGGFSSIFLFSTPYGSPASYSGVSRATYTTYITLRDGSTNVFNPGILQINVFSVSPEMNGNSSVVYNSRGFPESEFELQAPMVTYGFYGNFSSHFSLPISNVTSSTQNNFIIDKLTIEVPTPDYSSVIDVADITYKGKLETTKNATFKEFSYISVPFLALSEIIPMGVFPKLSLNWNIQPFGLSGSYFIFSPFNVIGQEKNGKVTIGDVAIALTFSYLTGGITKDELFSGIKNVIYHTIPIPVSEVNGGNDPALDAVKRLDQALKNPPRSSDILQMAKDIVKAISPGVLNTQLRQKYLLDPFVFNGSEMLISSYYNASAKQHQLYELWYINTTTYFNPTLYYRDSFKTNLLAVGGIGNKIYTVENYTTQSCGWLGWPCTTETHYTLNTYEVIPLGYKNPSPSLPFISSSRNLNTPLNSADNKKVKEDFFNSIYSQFNSSWIKFFGRTIYDETHDLYKVSSTQLSDCKRFISFTVDKSTGIAYVFCLFKKVSYGGEWGILPTTYYYKLYDSNGNKADLNTEDPLDFEEGKIASFNGVLFIGSGGEIRGYVINQTTNKLVEIGNSTLINYTDLNVSAYANYAYNNKKCNVVYDKAYFHDIIAMGVYNGFLYLVDHWTPGCGINEVRLRMIGIQTATDVIIDPFGKEDRLNCFKTQSCGNKAIAPPYGWLLASSRPDGDRYTFYPQASAGAYFGFPEIGAPISSIYFANMSIDDFGKIYLITSSDNGKSLAIIDLQPSNYTIYSYGASSLYACISSRIGSKVIIEQKGAGTKEITQNTKCFSGGIENITYLYGVPNILNYLNQIYPLPIGAMFSSAGIATNIATIQQGVQQFNEKTFYSQQSIPIPQYPFAQTTLTSSIEGDVILPFSSLYLYNQTSKLTLTDTHIERKNMPNWCSINVDEIAKNNAPPTEQIVYYPSKEQVYANYIFSTTSVGVQSSQLQTKFESSNMVFVIYTLINGSILPAFLYQKSLPQQLVSLSLFQILGLGSKPFGEAYLNVTPICASSLGYSSTSQIKCNECVGGSYPNIDTCLINKPSITCPATCPSLECVPTRNDRACWECVCSTYEGSTISKIRNFDYYTKVWSYRISGGYGKGDVVILNATGVVSPTKDSNLKNDYYFNVGKVVESAVEALNTHLNLATSLTPVLSFQYLPMQTPVLNKKVPSASFVENILSISSSGALVGRRSINVTFIDLFNTTFNLPMKVDLAYSTQINATLNTSLDKSNMNLTHVTIKGNLSKVIYDATTNSFRYEPLSGVVYIYVNRNINYCNRDCSKSLAEQNPLQAIFCSINGNCLLANPLNFTTDGKTTQYTAASTINYHPSNPLDKKNTICNIYGDTYPSSCSKDNKGNTYWCLPVYPNGTGYCTSQIGLITIVDTGENYVTDICKVYNNNFRCDFDIYGFGLGEKVILKYYGFPNFEKTYNGYIENYKYLPATTILSLNYGVLPLRFGNFVSISVVFIILISIGFVFILKRKKSK
jgi:hypothetical protein